MSESLDSRVDGLYRAPLDSFVAERNELVRALKREGESEAATEVAALRKPSLVAWTVNQLAHEKRRDVDLLLDAGKRIVDAQKATISDGGRGGLDTARTALRNAVTGLTQSARELLGPRASDATLREVAETLRSAATTDAGRELLARGRLSAQQSDTGWEIIAGLAPAAGEERPKPTRGEPPSDATTAAASDREREREARKAREAEVKAVRQSVRELRSERAGLVKRISTARRREREAAERLDAAQARREEIEAELAALEGELAEAEQQLLEAIDD